MRALGRPSACVMALTLEWIVSPWVNLRLAIFSRETCWMMQPDGLRTLAAEAL